MAYDSMKSDSLQVKGLNRVYLVVLLQGRIMADDQK